VNSYAKSESSADPAEGRLVPWKLSLGVVVVMSGLIACILVALPVKNGPFTVLASKLGLPGATQRFPQGQLQADTKTFVATLEWLFLPGRAAVRPTGTAPTNQPVREISAASVNCSPS